MIKLFWYSYFAIYLFLQSTSILKVKYLKLFKPEEVDNYVDKKIKNIARHILYKSKTIVEVYGLENIPSDPVVFVGNHEAIFDAFAILPYITKSGFIAKKEIQKLPLVNWWLRQIHSVFIDRTNVKDGIRAINQGVENIRKGYSMVIFPEGTRSLKSQMGEFKKGSLKLALKSKAPIVPFTVDGTYRVLEVGNKVRGNTIKIMFHPPININEISKEEEKNLSDIVYNIIKSGLDDFNKRQC
ncbi:1-acyl-sn-glycerol-3-phosphate acyltransferase [Clostridium sp. 19966]|uniref:lysophospholipid acyltransferase family protein n=1 Tax=Clostridium sp. 19966 TaxID=2768166 RepID=UPI0028DEF8EA|nr:lysophospholipid acyltransferase family protein [Clostridium sp. 19966]MDT8716282.1 1-acyl-sn-glycerol-3-phosphate acyltransferase [Clostridium sp. 19966]